MEQDFKEIFRSMLHVFFAFISGVLDWIVLILVGFERSLHSAQVSRQSCPWPIKLMMSEAVEGTWICTGSYGSSGANGLMKWDSGKVILKNWDPESYIIWNMNKKVFFFNFDSINISHSVFDPIRYIDVPCCHKFFIQLPSTVLKKGEDVDPS